MHREHLPPQDIYGLFDEKRVGPYKVHVSKVLTEEGWTRITLGEPCIAIDVEAYGTQITRLDGKPIVGRHASRDIIKTSATVDINSHKCTFPVYLSDHLLVDPEEQRRGYGMCMQQILKKMAKADRSHVAFARPNDAAEQLIRKFAADEAGIYDFEYHDHPSIMVKLK